MSKPVSQDENLSIGTGFAPDEPFPGSGPLVPETTVVPDAPRSKWVNRLQRTTSSGRFIPEVDGLRFIAILSVVIVHISGQIALKSAEPVSFSPFSQVLASMFDNGRIGVQLFFAISGFILALPFAAYHLKGGKPVAMRAYYLRRLTRLEPPYLVMLALFFVLIVLVLKESFAQQLPHLLASVFYLHNVIYGEGSSINYAAWSLEVEVQFYLLAPFLGLIFRVRPDVLRRAILIGLMLAFMIFQALLPMAGTTGSNVSILGSDFPRIHLSILGQAQYFIVGFLLADFYLTQWAQSNAKPMLWDICFFAGWPLFILILNYPQIAHWTVPFLIFALYAATFRGKWGRKILSVPALTVIGGMCYSIYLIHFQVIALVWRVSDKLFPGSDFTAKFLLQFMLLVPFILTASALFYLVFEKPCMNRHWPSILAARFRPNKRA